MHIQYTCIHAYAGEVMQGTPEVEVVAAEVHLQYTHIFTYMHAYADTVYTHIYIHTYIHTQAK